MRTNESVRPPDAPEKKRATKRLIAEVIVVLILIGLAVVLCFYMKPLIIRQIFRTIELKPDSEGYESWLNPPTSITRGYYLFNITNPTEIVTDPSSAVAHVKETPPYSYVLSATKKHVRWSDDKKALNYSIYRQFTRHPTRFNPSSVNDTGVFVDMLRATFRTQFSSKPAPAFYAIGGNDVFFRRNAVEQLEGFTSPLFFVMQEKMTGPNVAKSGYIYRYNGSRSYNYTIRTGLMKKGQVLGFGSENVPFSFSTPTPYDFPIYDGLTFVPMLFDKPSMQIFQADFCRPIRAQFNRVVRMFGGIDVHEFVIKLIDFDQCTNASDPSTCPEVDKLDISRCVSASLPANTVFLSKVHFYGASNETMEEMKLAGFTPTRDQHEALIYFEPYSGTPLRAHHRVQMNINAWIDPMRVSPYSSDLEPTGRRAVQRLLPLVWIDQEVNVDDATIRKLRMVHLALRYGQWVVAIVAILIALAFIGITEMLARRVTQNKRINQGAKGKAAAALIKTET